LLNEVPVAGRRVRNDHPLSFDSPGCYGLRQEASVTYLHDVPFPLTTSQLASGTIGPHELFYQKRKRYALAETLQLFFHVSRAMASKQSDYSTPRTH
jgi:hypothetical protein